MLKAVFDTNIFISAFLFPGGKPERVYRLATQKKIKLCTSPTIMAEVADKLRTKFQVEEEDIIDILKQIARIAEIVKPTTKIKVLDDDPDNRVLECAACSQTDLIVSGDKHLLRLKKYQDIPVIKVADLLHSFPKK